VSSKPKSTKIKGWGKKHSEGPGRGEAERKKKGKPGSYMAQKLRE
jgi:hypothetical protein